MLKTCPKLIALFLIFSTLVYPFPFQFGLPVLASGAELELVSVSSAGIQGNALSESSRIAADGRYVVFASLADNLVINDLNNLGDIFVHDRTEGTTERVSVNNQGEEADGPSFKPAISDDGRYVAFVSKASNLIEGDTNAKEDVFVRDRLLGETRRVSVSSTGSQGNQEGYATTDISGDGRYVVFYTASTNLVADDTNGHGDVFIHDLITGSTERVSVDSNGNQAVGGLSTGSSISSDGRYVVFGSNATNLVSNDTNDVHDIFLHDMVTGSTERVSVDSNGNQTSMASSSARMSISGDGRYVAFDSCANDLVAGDNNWRDVFVRDRLEGTTRLVSVNSLGEQANTDADFISVSDDGKYVVFNSYATNLVANDNNNTADVFVHNLQTGATVLISLRPDGTQGNGASIDASITADGAIAAFVSHANNLVANDTNGVSDIFVQTEIVTNQPPVADGGSDLTANEGETVIFDASGSSDPDGEGDIVNYDWDFGDESTGSGKIVQHAYADNGIYTATLTVTDQVGETDTDMVTATIDNLAPLVETIGAPLGPQLLGTVASASANFADMGILDTHTAEWDWGDGETSAGTVSETNGSGTVNGSHTYATAGVYLLSLTVTDKDSGVGQNTFSYIVIYNDEGGFVTGGGWIDSPEGAYVSDPGLTGKANFGFVSKYQQGSSVPSGNTKFIFSTADFKFASTAYDWLVVSGPKAQYKGSGEINGEGDYGFKLTANDGQVNGGEGVDKFRLKVWDKTTGEVIYDNQIGDDDEADATTALGGGSIVIHEE